MSTLLAYFPFFLQSSISTTRSNSSHFTPTTVDLAAFSCITATYHTSREVKEQKNATTGSKIWEYFTCARVKIRWVQVLSAWFMISWGLISCCICTRQSALSMLKRQDLSKCYKLHIVSITLLWSVQLHLYDTTALHVLYFCCARSM